MKRKRCPFCGCEHSILKKEKDLAFLGEYYFVQCCYCDTHGPIKHSKESANKAWGSRY